MSTLEPRLVVVDDTDPTIEYTGPWFQDTGSQDNVGNFGPAYLSSLHGTNQSASLSFAFNGKLHIIYDYGKFMLDELA